MLVIFIIWIVFIHLEQKKLESHKMYVKIISLWCFNDFWRHKDIRVLLIPEKTKKWQK